MVIDCKQLEVQVITYSKSQQRSMGAENTEQRCENFTQEPQ